jgi:16S rRNA processing protein RimM
MTAPSEWVGLARIRRPQGRKGEVFADILTDFPERFADRRRLWLVADFAVDQAADAPGPALTVTGHKTNLGAPGPSHLGTRETKNASSKPREVELTNHWTHKGGIVLHFAGINSISAAETLKGLTVAIPKAERASLAEDEIYIADLVGCVLTDVAGTAPVDVGIIQDVDRAAGPAPLLIVRSERSEILVPFAKAYLRSIDLAAKRVEMALPDGLIDLNKTGASGR